jgi:hypothetical protein
MPAYRFDIVSKGVSTEPLADGVVAAHASLGTDALYVVVGTQIRALGAGAAASGVWRSRKFASPYPMGFGWLRVAGPMLAPVTVRVICDGVTVRTATLSDRKPQRLPAVKGYRWELEMESTGRVVEVAMAQGQEELTP